MKVIMSASDYDPGRKPRKAARRRTAYAAMCAAAFVLATGAAVVHVGAAGAPDVPAATVQEQDAVPAAAGVPDAVPEPAAILGDASDGIQVQASSSQRPYVPLDGQPASARDPDTGTAQDQDAPALIGDAVALAASERERPSGAAVSSDGGQPAEPAAGQEYSKELADAKRELEAMRRELADAKKAAAEAESQQAVPAAPAAPEEPASQPVDTDPPEWLFANGDDAGDGQGIPEWLVVTDASGIPDWIRDPLDRAVYKNPYDGGPLSQRTYAQVPCPVDGADTRLYVEAGMPVTDISQADLLQFVSSAVRGCSASWATVVGSDGFGYQFVGCNTEYALYGALDEYGQVSEPLYFLALTDDGYVIP